MLNHIFARCLRLFGPSRPNGAASLFSVLSGLLAAQALLAGANPALAAGGNQRKALVMGRKAEGDASHPRIAMMNFLRLVGNPENDPAKGWTGDFEWDLKVRLGMNPTNTSAEASTSLASLASLARSASPRSASANCAALSASPSWAACL